ncbi:carotenoid oxygenase, partial [Baffinella frigidus]
VEGTIPSDLVGTLYRAGPGSFELGDFKLQHPLDGDGLVTAFTFSGDGKVSFRRKFVKTEQRIREQKALDLGYKGEPVKRGFFGSGKQGGLLGPLKNAANVAAFYWGGRVLVLSEAAPPVEIDPAGLYT